MIDITRGILIISMIIGHFNIDPLLRKIIFSCHMISFVFLSGYCYKKPKNLLKTILHMCRTMLLPYLLCFLIEILVNLKQFNFEYFFSVFKCYIWGYSFTSKFHSNTPSVGPVYFILLLFCTRMIFILIDYFCTTTRIEVQMSFKFAEVHSEDGVLKERVHIKPDYILNRNIFWNSDPFIFLDEYYNLLRIIDIENLDFKHRDVPREHLHLRLPPPVVPLQQEQQQTQPGQAMSEESESEGEEQEGQNEPILNEANIVDEYMLDGFDSDEYYDGFNHP